MISRRFAAVIAAVLCLASVAGAQNKIVLPEGLENLPDSVYVGGEKMHVQGLALDKEKQCLYMSFTSQFYKVDYQGNILASIDRIQGHLGAMTWDPQSRKVYASLECKNDIIGANISKTLGVAQISKEDAVFYVAVIDVDKMVRMGMDAEKDDVLKTVCIKEACRDYAENVSNGGVELEHRYGCSGIDGVTIAPAPGKKSGKKYLWVAYGIYSDLDRTDNDYQVLLRYDVSKWDSKYAQKVVFGTVHKSGPEKPLAKYHVYTCNTNWGVQNMAYDETTGKIFLAVYKGKKPGNPNYDLYSIDICKKPFKAELKGCDYQSKALQLKLAEDGLHDAATGTWGWRFKWGSTGFCPVGDGFFIISENAKDKQTKLNSCNARLYQWTGNAEKPFKKVNR